MVLHNWSYGDIYYYFSGGFAISIKEFKNNKFLFDLLNVSAGFEDGLKNEGFAEFNGQPRLAKSIIKHIFEGWSGRIS